MQKQIPFSVEEAMKSGSYISGTTGTGKSDVGMEQADMLMQEGITVFGFDGTMDWLARSTVPHYTNDRFKKTLRRNA